MDFNFTEEQTMIRDSLSRLIREQYDFDTRRKVVASKDGWRPEMWAQFAELGLLMAPFSEEDGGLGGGPIDAMVVMEEFGKGLVVEPYLPSVVCGGGFLKRGSDAQKAEYLGGIMSGEAIFAFAYAEPRGRYNMADLETTAKKDGSGFVLNGHKAVVIGAPWATHFVVTARTSGDRRDANGVTVFVVAKDAKGVSTRDYPTVDGRRASEVYFENVAVSADAVIGEVDNGLPLVELVTDEAIAALCAEACGAMKVAHSMTVEYSRNRKQFGTAIGKFQVLQHRMVDMFMEHEQSVSMTYMATLKLDEDEVTRKKAASAAKVRIGQGGRYVGQQAIQIHGGMGMTDEMAVGHYFKRLTMIDAEFGNVDHHLKRYTELSAVDVPMAAE
ncbi:MAG: acyl-CoA dehydrogenase family protein [Alphaproteobacteria bacterium]|nr:acyl-CoA dehydrogenase family protein [Alphaproteobacteria bacterium]MBU2083333.1 acyl-CoA dehydrogenase family protein [Alphaproteobacteria bacterium]MBU2143702.1 acyl-CoA dehydrogenase family protein [Alphaproteobacteria bacterium]MBU2195617.1 acyl-CoA dehydrogenase family protein [Alphaproteobacteria bacterium]